MESIEIKMKKEISELEAKLGVEVDEEILSEAFTHRSFNGEDETVLINNERIEFLGDAVLELLITEHLFREYPDLKEGTLTSIRAAVVKTESLAEESERLELGKYLRMSRGEEATGGRNRPYILANTFEAFVGSIYLSKGLEEARKFLVKELFYKIDEVLKTGSHIDNKSELQEKVQEKLKLTPSYRTLSQKGPDHDKIFRMAVYIGGVKCGEGEGRSKQKAEQEAAGSTLENWSKFFKLVKKKSK